MSSEWKRCRQGDVFGRWAGHYVTINPRGFIVMSRKTHTSLKNPEAVYLYFDAINGRIGVKGVDPRSPDIFRVGKSGRHGGRVIRAFKLMQEFGITVPQTLKFQNVMIDKDGVLVLDLRTATTRKKEK